MSSYAQLAFVSLVTMGISHTIARERIFAPLRKRLGGAETWLGYLVSCPYCVSQWVAAALVPLTGLYAVEVGSRVSTSWADGGLVWLARWFLSAQLVAVLAAFFRVIFYVVDETQGLVRRRQREVEEEVATQKAVRADVRAGGANGIRYLRSRLRRRAARPAQKQK